LCVWLATVLHTQVCIHRCAYIGVAFIGVHTQVCIHRCADIGMHT